MVLNEMYGTIKRKYADDDRASRKKSSVKVIET